MIFVNYFLHMRFVMNRELFCLNFTNSLILIYNMNEYEIYFIGSNGKVMFGYFYGKDAQEAKRNANAVDIPYHKMLSCTFKEAYRGYGHV